MTNVFICLLSVAGIVGSVLPWVTAPGRYMSGWLGDGKITVGAFAIALGCSLSFLLAKSLWKEASLWGMAFSLRLTSLGCAAVALYHAGANITRVQYVIDNDPDRYAASQISIGPGLWVLLAAAAGVLALLLLDQALSAGRKE